MHRCKHILFVCVSGEGFFELILSDIMRLDVKNFKHLLLV